MSEPLRDGVSVPTKHIPAFPEKARATGSGVSIENVLVDAPARMNAPLEAMSTGLG